jgi:hypothetical protein
VLHRLKRTNEKNMISTPESFHKSLASLVD